MNSRQIGPPADRIVTSGVKNDTLEVLEYLIDNAHWRDPAQRAIMAVYFWMDENGVTKRALAEKMGISEQAMGKLLRLDHDFKLSTIGRLSKATGLDLFAVMAGAGADKPKQSAQPAARDEAA